MTMTGRELIVYILTNHLEDEVMFKNGSFVGYIAIEEAAARSDVGIETIKAWIDMALVPTIKFNGEIYIPANELPKKK